MINREGIRDAQWVSVVRLPQVDGVLEVNSPQQIGNLTSSESAWQCGTSTKDSELRFGLLEAMLITGSSSGEGSLIKNGKGTQLSTDFRSFR